MKTQIFESGFKLVQAAQSDCASGNLTVAFENAYIRSETERADLLAQRDALKRELDERTVKLNVALDERDHLASVNDALLLACKAALQCQLDGLDENTVDTIEAAIALAQKGPL